MSSLEQARIDTFEVGDKVYANLKGLVYIQTYYPELFEYALNNSFVIEHVSPLFDEYTNCIYTMEKVGHLLHGSQHNVDLHHDEVDIESSETIPEIVLDNEKEDDSQMEDKTKKLVMGMSTTRSASVPISWEKATDTITTSFEQRGKELGALVDRKQQAYGNAVKQTYDVVRVFLEPYRNGDEYTIPESLLMHLLLMVRIIDKQNRIFNNPDFDLMEENTYSDLAGYGLLGEALTTR